MKAIAHQGAEATHFGVVLSGTVAASAVTNGTRALLGQLRAGDQHGGNVDNLKDFRTSCNYVIKF